VLSVTLEGVTKKGIAALAKLKHLQQFLYEDIFFRDEVECEYFAMCLRLLPNLLISNAGVKIELERNIGILGCSGDGYPFGCWQKIQVALRQLVVSHMSNMPENLSLPDLKTLHLYKPGPNFSLQGFSSVTELALQNLKQQLFEQILASIGHQLQALAVAVTDTLRLDGVFRMCPNLHKFFLWNFPKFISLSDSLGQLSRLVEFGFAFKAELCEREIDGEYRFQPMHLLQMLTAVPNLRVLRMKNYFFNELEFELISEALEQNSILQNLEQFHFKMELSVADNLQSHVISGVAASNQVLRSLIDHCPKLVTCAVKLNNW